MMYRWRCYLLVDPVDDHGFYIGITRRTCRERLAGHTSDPSSAAYGRIREIKARGLQPICVVLKTFDNEEAARSFERSMLVLIDYSLVNREPRWPIVGETLYRREDRYDQPWAAHDDGCYAEPVDDGWEIPKLRKRQ
jgi:hypothetical protein